MMKELCVRNGLRLPTPPAPAVDKDVTPMRIFLIYNKESAGQIMAFWLKKGSCESPSSSLRLRVRKELQSLAL